MPATRIRSQAFCRRRLRNGKSAFAEMAREAELSTTDFSEGYRIVASYWQGVI